ncbi:MAG: 30S ribosomal protein S12 methylthiotransferase RimO, partial [Eubacteriales bacterium]
TCGFINDAKKESIDTIFETAQLKKSAGLKGIIVTGCLSKRYKDVLFDQIPEADVFLGTENYHDIVDAVETAYAGQRKMLFENENIDYEADARVLTTYPHSAYIKIAEGCDNRCAYCAIPMIRGRYRSRTMESIVTEAKALVERGVKEITLIAQDTTQYGVDIYTEPQLPELLRRVAAVEGVAWLRVLYSYPERITDELLEVIDQTPNIVKYLDMPIQHFSDSVLKAMNRKSSYASVMDLLKKIRTRYPDMILRTTLLVGFPGETQEDFELLLKSVKQTEFDRLGCFAFSKEEGTKAFKMAETVSEKEKEKRKEEVMAVQAEISLKKNKAKIGQTYRVIIDEYDADIFMYIARSYECAPESDGKIFVTAPEPLNIGEFYDVTITDSEYHDLMGEIKE